MDSKLFDQPDAQEDAKNAARLSEVIAILTEIYKKEGDLPVFVTGEWTSPMLLVNNPIRVDSEQHPTKEHQATRYFPRMVNISW